MSIIIRVISTESTYKATSPVGGVAMSIDNAIGNVFDCAETIIHNIELIRQDAFSDDVDFEQIRHDLTNLAARVMETVKELYWWTGPPSPLYAAVGSGGIPFR